MLPDRFLNMRILTTLLVLWVLLAGIVSPVSSAERSLVLESFQADIRVEADGTLLVEETIRPRFMGSWNGIFRFIPIRYRSSAGFTDEIRIKLISITDEQNRPLRHEDSRERHYLKYTIWVPGAQDATRTVVLRYRVHRAVRFFDLHDELYWNVTGDESELPIENAGARIYLPAGVSGLRATAFVGPHGSIQPASSVQVGEHDVSVEAGRELGFREGLTVVVGWNPGIVSRPGKLEKTADFLRSNWILTFPLLALAVMFQLWRTRGRDPRLGSISPQYEPPENLTPAEIGTLVDHSPDIRDITATLVDLAVRGYLVIREEEKDRFFGLWSEATYSFERTRADWTGLGRHERALLEALFKSGDSVSITELENSFYKALPGIRDSIFSALVTHGFYRQRPDRVRTIYLVVGLAVAAAIAVLGFNYGIEYGLAPLSIVLSAAASALILVLFALIMPARTQRGSQVLERILGFEEFLERVESDRFERTIQGPELFEKYLPFAMALGVEKKWAEAFQDIYTAPPSWYQGTHPHRFSASHFTSRMSSLSSRTASAMTSAPRSSGGSGFSGGSSGGGFGGGGTGGF